jgi:hypothetical protein
MVGDFKVLPTSSLQPTPPRRVEVALTAKEADRSEGDLNRPQDSSDARKEESLSAKYKTELCRNWEAGHCDYGEHCAFAHGPHELREKQATKKAYKSKPCKAFNELGFCMYGSRCQFIHSNCRKRLSTFLELTMKNGTSL